MYTNKTGAGTKTLTVNYNGRCGEALTKKFTVTVK